MLQGLRKKWKQPISFHFSQGGMNSNQLKILIKNTIQALQEIGFIIVATVCDQYAANVNAIKQLKSESPRISASDIDLFQIGEDEIVAIYDPPHLLKGIRNNLLLNNVTFMIDNIQKVANWDHITKLYELDEGDFNTRMCYKLTDAHIYKEKLKKMKVKHAAQVFSHRVSTTMQWTVKNGREGILPKPAEDTATFISFMDQVFDSINGSTYNAEHGKELRCAVKADSPHLAFWKSSIKIFQSMAFKTPKGDRTPPSIKNWIKTLRGFIYIWRKLDSIGFKYLCPRRINQDPLENFFGRIRSQGVRNVNPTCYSFISSFKTLIINNFVSPHSPNANCEDDDNNVLDSLKHLLNPESCNIEGEVLEEDDVIDFGDIEFHNVEDTTILATHAYIAGYIAKKIKKTVGECSTCTNQMQATSFSQEHSFISDLEYRPKSLIKTKTQFRRMFSNMVTLFMAIIKKTILMSNLKKKMSTIFKEKLYNPFICVNHNVFDLYIDLFLTLFIFNYLKNINSILMGRVEYNIKDKDVLKQLAWQRFLKLKSKNKKIETIKQLK